MRQPLLLPSLLACDFARLADQLAWCEEMGANVLHVDVMDGHFVPNLSFGPMLIEAMRRSTGLKLDVHLMMRYPLEYLAAFRDAGSDCIYIHAEAIGARRILDGLQQVRDTGAEVGLVFNPDTDPMMWTEALGVCDTTMIMTVYPGFGGQKFIEATRPRIRAVRAAFPDLPIQVDGGINRETMAMVTADGADRLVVGSAFFGDDDPADMIRQAKALAVGDGTPC